MGRILVVDDEVQIRELLRRELTIQNHQVVSSPRADQALDAVAQQSFDLILLDLNMPGISGQWFLKKIRESQRKVPVVVFSGCVSSEIEKELREFGANEVLDKSVGVTQLVAQVNKVLGAKDRIFQDPNERKRKTILVVDDEKPVRDLVVNFFISKNYKTLEAAEGETAIQVLQEEKPSVILLDVNMPGWDGLTTLRKIREIDSEVGVVMATGQQDDETVKKAMEIGAYGYVLKPFDFLYLELVVMSKLVIAESH